MAQGLSTDARSTVNGPPDDERWDAVLARDASFDGHFYYAVVTTGVYCRPSCPARRPHRKHVRFLATAAAAEAAGFRPCKRCKPNQSSHLEGLGEKIATACRLIETAEAPPTLRALADAVGVSPAHFHRLFKSATGLTPKSYATAHRSKRVRDELGKSPTITQAIYDAGFNSNGRFYATATQALGMSPRTFRSGGTGTEIRYATTACSLGRILVAASDKGVCAILLGDDSETLLVELGRQFPRAQLIGGDKDFEALAAKVIALVETPIVKFDLPLDIQGTAFQHRVWEALGRIPAGTTVTYKDIAEAIGAPNAIRAVASACAANRLAVAIPCHRVIRGDGSLSGYRWGIERKRALLAKEAKSRD
jgi:AraC family transcriptional regulator of adaptative response/methylated-DNA-[protein]-cysteine methyltransferase